MDRDQLVLMMRDAIDAAQDNSEISARQANRLLRRCDYPQLFSRFWDRVEEKVTNEAAAIGYTFTPTAIDWQVVLDLIIKLLPIIIALF